MLLGVNVHGKSDKFFDSYLQEYMWKKQHKGGKQTRSRSRVTPRRCANLSLRYRLRNSIQLALTLLFTFKTKRMTVSCFVFGVQYVCHHTGKAKPDVKLFGVLGRRTEERERHPG